ncbi:acetyl-CoA carboxylase biotin carboxylase subunit [Variovorax sp. J22R133]|uniref:acetyl-CoA carboxylase biotin carboxylase subunit n=1 Tax=Variovorax brevis TaxID=3053503 RepID=UPI00257850A3|nr:acetyl-CoA carboxylase biotin carboxylase subunit [Variovorax sp. J22R133]MDM0114739.1 acetyl-CoA carboxylase biotin carboxylase subunit [Variovorax sp. J22R133]
MSAPRTPFRNVLVANRGEIAMRVMRSARQMGLRTVAVHSTADARSPHVQRADESVCIGEALPAQSYLRIDAIVEAARQSGADAIHPGYGFLAENADFAQACRDAGIVFIGPSPEAIRAMGDKAGAKRLMAAAGVPCIAGYQGEDQGAATLAREAARIGWPVMIKATAGGGGRGMRLVPAAAQFEESLRSAQSEALHAFGDATVILERAIVAPRHIEIQVMADRHGHAIHLGERDCSVQRRHQKVIEEAPSPAVSPELRERMGAVAVAAVRAIRYEGAGTLEFLLDGDGQFWFMEMNTRLQVEHPVTEAVTGLDLVAMQLRIAAGEALSLKQEDVRFKGHAIEVRLCAEDPSHDFMPHSGTLSLWQPSAALRVEHALVSGAEVPPFYDSMIAKVVAHGDTRASARQQLLAGLEDTVALGVSTNQHFLQRCLAHPVFAAGDATTAFIGAHGDELLARDAAAESLAAQLGAVLLQAGTRVLPSPLAHGLTAPLRFTLDGAAHEARVTLQGAGVYRVEMQGAPVAGIGLDDMGHNGVHFSCNGVQRRAIVIRDDDRLLMHLAGRPFELRDLSLAPREREGATGGDGLLRASMNGRVIALLAAEGDVVAAGQPIVTLEAMKMEHLHCAPHAGRVHALRVSVGEQVAARQVVAEVAAIHS